MNDLKIEKYVGFEQQSLSKNTHSDESPNKRGCSAQGINHLRYFAWKLPGREIVAIHVHTLHLPHVDRRVKTFTVPSMRYI